MNVPVHDNQGEALALAVSISIFDQQSLQLIAARSRDSRGLNP